MFQSLIVPICLNPPRMLDTIVAFKGNGMFIYSKKIIRFVSDIKRMIRDVLSQELCLKVGQSRFYNQRGTISYPIHVVIYNHKSMLGYFDPSFYELGFHECLMHSSQEQLGQVVRHEIAHYINFIKYGLLIQPHGVEFKSLCAQMGWSEEVSRATLCLEDPLKESAPAESVIFRKVQKLLALASSRNQHEAELAMLKSQQLLLKHNLESKYVEGDSDEKVVLKRILKQKRVDAKMRALAKILETFFVGTVYNRAGGFIHLEIMGSAANVEIADYVAAFLQDELECLWDQARQHTSVRGLTARNSFFLGLAKGYCNKVQALKRDYPSAVTQVLMVIEKQLVDAKALIYPRLSSTRSSAGHCQAASALGERMGKQLHINPALRSSTHSEGRLLR
jgi:hypothetical protein